MARLLRSCALLAIVSLAACAAPMQLPDGFVELRDSGQGYRAITSDDARIWVRDLDEPTEAPIEFWAETLQRDLVDRRGYELIGSGEVENRDGEAGRWIEATTNVGGERVEYLVAMWCRGATLRVVEFAAPSEVYARRVAAAREALSTVHW